MTQVEKINSFLSQSNLSDTELLLKQRVIDTDQKLSIARKELEELTTKTAQKQNEALALTHQLQSLLALVLDVQSAQESKVVEESLPNVVVGE